MSWIAFLGTFTLFLVLGGLYGLSSPAWAAPAPLPPQQTGGYAGPEACAGCHADITEQWQVSRHAMAFSSPIFQQNWEEIGSEFRCLECHTTGYNPNANTYAHEGVTCEGCHGRFQPDHPEERMPIVADAELCATCHKSTTDEWKASQHGQTGIQCQSCHDPHAQLPKIGGVSELCMNCHKEPGSSFTHGTHAEAGLECSNCHMFTSPRSDPPIEGLVPTGHTFSVGSQACIGCHQDTVHTRDKILALTGEVESMQDLTLEELQQQVHQQEERISELEASNTVRLYIGLAQGGIVGLVTGAAAAWVVGRRVQVVEVDEGEEDE